MFFMARRAWSAWCQDWPIEVKHKLWVLELFTVGPRLPCPVQSHSGLCLPPGLSEKIPVPPGEG
ncbi:hypothetical protein SK1NUM_14740 [Arachnia rubra]|nr:hypothetical protein SK1NUM_14740 [Arachnia rubra]